MSALDNVDATSAFTGYMSAMDKNIDSKDKITVDYFPMQGPARRFKARTATLSMLGIEDYDAVRNVENLNPNVREALNFSKKRFGTLDVEKIKRLFRFSIVRELNLIEGRKNAQLFEKRRQERW